MSDLVVGLFEGEAVFCQSLELECVEGRHTIHWYDNSCDIYFPQQRM